MHGKKKGRGFLHRLKGWVRLHPLGSPSPHRNSTNKKKKQDPTKFYHVLDDLFEAAIRNSDAATIEPIIHKLSPRTICRLKKTTTMGLYRLFRREGRWKIIEHIITTYLASPKHTHLKLYFLEPLAELDCAKVLRDASLVKFAEAHRPPSSLQVLKTLSTEYEPADEADHRNFERLILEPLRVLSQQPNNLMDIRFSPEQRMALQTKIRSSLIDGRPLSLLRLGDGEAYPFPVPEVEGNKLICHIGDHHALLRSSPRGTEAALNLACASSGSSKMPLPFVAAQRGNACHRSYSVEGALVVGNEDVRAEA
jgi:hypothetical protein